MRPTARVCVLWLVALTVGAPASAQMCVPAAPGLVAWWPFDETTGAVASDIEGLWPEAYFGQPSPAAGRVGGALRFTGTGDFAAAADSNQWAFGAGDFTIEFWANWDAPGGGTISHAGDIFIGSDDGPGSRNKWFFALGGGVLHFTVYNTAHPPPNFFLVRAPFSPVVGDWYHLAVTKTGALFTIFVNGVPVGSEISTSPIANASASLTIGQAESLGFMNGRLDEMSIYDRALAPAELAAIHAASSSGKCRVRFGGGVTPRAGGDTGSVSVAIAGGGFLDGATARLTRSGFPDIPASGLRVELDGSTLLATFDLTGQPQGAWSVVVSNPASAPYTLPGAFTIEPGVPSQLWADVIGRGALRAGRDQTITVLYGNRGNTDVVGGSLFVGIPAGVEYAFSPDGDRRIPQVDEITQFVLPHLAAGATGALSLTLRPSLALSSVRVEAAASADGSAFDADVAALASGEINFPAAAVGGGLAVVAGGNPYLTIPKKVEDLVVLPDGFGERFRVPDPREPGRWEDTLGYRLRDKIVWNQNPDGLVEAPWQDFLDGKVTPRKKDGTSIPEVDVQFLFSFMPGKAAAMPAIAENMGRNHDFVWNGPITIDYCNPTVTKPICNYPELSCFGWFHDVRWRGAPDNDGKVPYKCTRGDDLCSIHEAVTYFLSLNGQTAPAENTTLPASEAPSAWSNWWRNALRELLSLIVGAFDPNDKFGPQGAGPDRYVSGAEPLTYQISFENIPTATAPAQEVEVVDHLDPALFDLRSVTLPLLSVGSTRLQTHGRASGYLDLRPRLTLLVRWEAALEDTGTLKWRFRSIDPATGDLPDDPFAGFLPPNLAPPQGEGSVLLTVLPRRDLPTGTTLRNRASIVFDTNPPIMTPEWSNTLDNSAPTSRMDALPAVQTSTDVPLSWQGTDEGAGIALFTIYVSDNGGPYTLWRQTSQTAGTFAGLAGHEYQFYSVAADLTGNLESTTQSAEAATRIVLPASIGLVKATPVSIARNTPSTVTVTAEIGDPTVLANGVNLLRLAANGSSSVLGSMRDDGLGGDAVANDRIFTARVTLNEPFAGQVQLRVSAAFRGQLRRILSTIVAVVVDP